jgi:hypothetical protein
LLQFILFCCSVAVASEVEATVVEAAIVESAVVKIAEAAIVESTVEETAVVESTVEETAIVESTVVVDAREIVRDNHTMICRIRHRLGHRRFCGSQRCEARQKGKCRYDEKPSALAL